MNILPKKLNHADYLVNFELFYKDNGNLQVLSIEDLDFIKSRTKSSLSTYSNNVSELLSKREFGELKEEIYIYKKILIRKSDKGNSIVIVDRGTYIKKMENFLSDQNKFQKTAVKDDNFLNFISSQEKRIDYIYKKLVALSAYPKEEEDIWNQWEIDLE